MSNTNTFILQEVIDILVDGDKSLVSPLMKLNYFGRLIKNDELIQYTLNELNGYKGEESEIPSYRKTPSKIMVDVQAYMNKHVVQVPASMLAEPFNEVLKYISVREGIGALEKTSESYQHGEGGNNQFGREVPMEMLPYIQPAVSKLYKSDVRLDAVGARILGNGLIIVEIINHVRTRLLAFAMEVGEKFGYNIEITSFKKNQDNNNQTIIHYMNTEIKNVGDGNVVNTGSGNTISATINITKGDIKALKSSLEQQGIEAVDVEEITDIVQVEQPDYHSNKLGEKSNNWILKIIGKALTGAGKIATGVSSNLLATLIKQYYGMP